MTITKSSGAGTRAAHADAGTRLPVHLAAAANWPGILSDIDG